MDGELCLDHVGDAILGAQPGVKRERHPIMDQYTYIISTYVSQFFELRFSVLKTSQKVYH